MSATFQVRTQAYLGTGYTETTVLSDNLTAGAKYITDLVRPDVIDEYCANLTDNGSGVTVSGSRLVRANKGGYKARRIDAGLKTQSTPSGAISTVAIVSGGSGYALNDVLTLSQGSSGTCTVTAVSSGVVTAVEITTAGSSFTQGVKTTTVVPSGGTSCTLFIVPTNSSIHEATTTDPVWYIENAKGYVLPSGGTIVGMTYPTVAYGDSTISNFPTELDQAVVLYAVIQGCIELTNTNRVALNALSYATITPPTIIADFSLSATAPTAPADSSYSYTDAILGAFAATTIGSLGTPPTYTKPTTTFALGDGTTVAQTARYIGLTSEDLEKAKEELDAQRALLSQYQSDISNELNEYNKESEIYKSTFQTAIRQAELDQERLMLVGKNTTDLNIQNKIQGLNASIQLYKDKLEKFVAQINLYESQVNTEVKTYQQKLGKFQAQLGLYSGQVQDAQIKYQADQQKLNSQITHFELMLTSVKKEFEDYLKGRV